MLAFIFFQFIMKNDKIYQFNLKIYVILNKIYHVLSDLENN